MKAHFIVSSLMNIMCALFSIIITLCFGIRLMVQGQSHPSCPVEPCTYVPGECQMPTSFIYNGEHCEGCPLNMCDNMELPNIDSLNRNSEPQNRDSPFDRHSTKSNRDRNNGGAAFDRESHSTMSNRERGHQRSPMDSPFDNVNSGHSFSSDRSNFGVRSVEIKHKDFDSFTINLPARNRNSDRSISFRPWGMRRPNEIRESPRRRSSSDPVDRGLLADFPPENSVPISRPNRGLNELNSRSDLRLNLRSNSVSSLESNFIRRNADFPALSQNDPISRNIAMPSRNNGNTGDRNARLPGFVGSDGLNQNIRLNIESSFSTPNTDRSSNFPPRDNRLPRTRNRNDRLDIRFRATTPDRQNEISALNNAPQGNTFETESNIAPGVERQGVERGIRNSLQSGQDNLASTSGAFGSIIPVSPFDLGGGANAQNDLLPNFPADIQQLNVVPSMNSQSNLPSNFRQQNIPQPNIPHPNIPPNIPQPTIPQPTIPQPSNQQPSIPQQHFPQSNIPQQNILQQNIPQATVPQTTRPGIQPLIPNQNTAGNPNLPHILGVQFTPQQMQAVSILVAQMRFQNSGFPFNPMIQPSFGNSHLPAGIGNQPMNQLPRTNVNSLGFPQPHTMGQSNLPTPAPTLPGTPGGSIQSSSSISDDELHRILAGVTSMDQNGQFIGDLSSLSNTSPNQGNSQTSSASTNTF